MGYRRLVIPVSGSHRCFPKPVCGVSFLPPSILPRGLLPSGLLTPTPCPNSPSVAPPFLRHIPNGIRLCGLTNVDYFLRNKPSVIGLMHAVHDGIAHMIVADSDVFLLRSQTVHLCVTSLMTAPSCVSWTEALCLSDCLYTALPR